MPKEPMSTFVAGGKEFEVVDKAAREKISSEALLLDNPSAFLKHTHAWFVHNEKTLAQQGLCITNNYIVLAHSSISPNENEENCLYVLDKDTFEPAELSGGNPIYYSFDETTTPTLSHATNIFFDESENEVYLMAASSLPCIVYNADTFVQKRVEERHHNPSWFAHDNVTEKWVEMWYTTTSYTFYIYDSDKTTLSKTFNISADTNILQGLLFHDGLIYASSTLANSKTTENIYKRSQEILVVNLNGEIVKDWWLKGIYEIEGVDFIDEDTLLLSSSSNGYGHVFMVPIRSNPGVNSGTEKLFSLSGGFDSVPTFGIEKLFKENVFEEYSIASSEYVQTDGYFERLGSKAIVYINTVTGVPSKARTVICTIPDNFLPRKTVESDFLTPDGEILRLYLNANTKELSIYNYSTKTTTINARLRMPYFTSAVN